MNLPSATDKKAFYDTYHKKNANYFSVIKDNDFTYFYILRSLSAVLNTKKIKKAMDIGCGVGTLGFYIASKRISVDGYDVSTRAISIASQYKEYSKIANINFYNDDVQKKHFNSLYDLVICTEVIEHLEDDVKMLKTINKSLREKGYLLLSTPSINAPLYKMGLLKKFDIEVGHLRRYKMEQLIKTLEVNGFEIVHSHKVEGIIRNSLFTFPALGNFIRLIKGPLIPIFHSVDMFSAKLFGESDLIILAQKK